MSCGPVVSLQTPNMRLMPGRKPLELFIQVGLEWGGQTALTAVGKHYNFGVSQQTFIPVKA